MTDYPPAEPLSDQRESPAPAGPAPASNALFYQIWLLALTRPRQATFQNIVEDAGASIGRAALWIFLSSLVSYGAAVALQMGQFASMFDQLEESTSVGALAGGTVITLLCALPFVAGAAVLGAMLYAALLQFVASALGGDGSFQDLFYGTASFTAPMTLITTAFGLIPIVGACLTIPLSFYTLYLNALVIKATNRIGWGSAIVTLLVPVILVVLVGLIIVALLFPMMQELIQSELGTF